MSAGLPPPPRLKITGTPAARAASSKGFTLGMAAVQRIVVTTNTSFPKFAKIYAETPLEISVSPLSAPPTLGTAPYSLSPGADSTLFRERQIQLGARFQF